MLHGGFIILASFVYLGILFAIARYGDRRADEGRSIIDHPTIYALSLAVYCTSWTFYGSVGRAASSGIGFLPIYLGPTLIFLLWGVIVRRMIRISRALRLTSIADFIAARYGKSPWLAGLVTVIAVIGVVPYIALQLKAVSSSFTVLYHYPEIAMPTGAEPGDLYEDKALWVAMILAVFTILFGTRHLDATERHEGMVAAIAFESVVKLIAFLAVGFFVTYGIYDGFGDIFTRALADDRLAALLTFDPGPGGYGSWASLTVLSMLSILLLPRQFQIGVVENVNERHLSRAVWMLPLYLLLINIFVLPIALGGLMAFDPGSVDADTFVLALPMQHRNEALALLVFIGGLSAATGMVIVETIALSTMVCNDLVMPWLLRRNWHNLSTRSDLSGLLLAIRRWAIFGILCLGYVYYRAAGDAYALVSIGLISFAAVAQFAPAIIGALFWRHGTRQGALAGLGAGFLVWCYTLLLPSFAKSGWLSGDFVDAGLFGWSWLKPQALFGLHELDPMSHALFWSLLANLGAFVAVSLFSRPDSVELGQADLFVNVLERPSLAPMPATWRGSASREDLVALLRRFHGARRCDALMAAYARRRGLDGVDSIVADAAFVQFAETQLAGAIGTASARVMVASVVTEESLGLDEVMHILDEASQVRQHSRELERKSRELEAATEELRAANERLKELDRMKDDFVSTVTHELRTPLTSIRAFSEMLLDDPKVDLAERKRFLGIIVSETERLTRLINQVLDFAKIESGQVAWNTEVLSLEEIVRDSLAAIEQLFDSRRIAIHSDILHPGVRVRADRDRLLQVMINLLSNAAKFVPERGGRVNVKVEQADDVAIVTVADNGPGIADADLEAIFQRFRQGGTTLTGKPQGTGLGLPISRQIVEHFGGALWAESPQGGGARFSFKLPVVGANQADGNSGDPNG